MKYSKHLAVLTDTDPPLGEAIGRLKNLEAVLAWVPTAGVSLTAADLVQQDEYSYDFLLPLPDGRWLSFGVS